MIMTGASGRRDESVTFSLRELQELEQERIAREKREAEEREAAAARAREESARREAEAIAARERAEAEAREAERRRELEELARREAMQKALVEQARIEVEARTRAEEADRERRHERELAALRASQAKQGPGGFVASAIGGAVVALLAASVVYFAALKPNVDRQIAELGDQSSRADSRSAELERRADSLQAALDGAQRELKELRERPAPVAAPAPKGPTATGTGPRTPRATQAAPPLPPTVCLKGDPLCPTITPGR